MMMMLLILFFFLNLACLPNPSAPKVTVRRPDDHQQIINDHKDHTLLSDKKHSNYITPMAKKHFVERFRKEEGTEITDDQVKFYYFSAYDNDHNDLLDGTELRNARIDYEVDFKETEEHSHINEIDDDVEDVLYEDDLDNDGYISWHEYFESEQLHDLLTNT